MLFGRAPWKANTEAELLKRILETPVSNLIPKGSLSNASIEFLRRTLDPDSRTRMTPEQLQKFTFGSKSKVIGSATTFTPKINTVSYIK